ncbi:WbqC-like protein family protein [compost metagenome]
MGGTHYLSGPAAESYLDISVFAKAEIAVEYKSYDYEPYPQLGGSFEGAVSILDLLMNTGKDARRFIKSRTPNRQVTG